MSTKNRQFAAIIAQNNVTVKRDEFDTGYTIRKGGALVTNVQDAFLASRGEAKTPDRVGLFKHFTIALEGMSFRDIRNDRAEVEKRAGDVYCKLGLWGTAKPAPEL